jgi:membrane protein YdbS with pleckstrin-like domain
MEKVNEYNLKYKKKSAYSITATIFLFLTVISSFVFGFVVFNCSSLLEVFRGYSLLILIFVILTLIFAIYFFNISKINYVSIKSKKIIVNSGTIFSKSINMDKVEKIKIKDNMMIIMIKDSEDEININLRKLTLRNEEKLMDALSNYIRIY